MTELQKKIRLLSICLTLTVLCITVLPVSVRATQKISLPDIREYCSQAEISFRALRLSDGRSCRPFESEENCFSQLQSYVELLCEEYDFELTGGTPYYHEAQDGYAFFDFCLQYTGSEDLGEDRIEGTFSEEKGHIMIYGMIVREQVAGAAYFVPGIKLLKDV